MLYGISVLVAVVVLVVCAAGLAHDLRQPGMSEQDVRQALYGDHGWGR